ncbi:MAG: hypothetical protein QW540_10130 [Archaeoglobaceae archaeon]
MRPVKPLTDLDKVELTLLLRKLPPWCRFILRMYCAKLKELTRPTVSADGSGVSSNTARSERKSGQ